MNEIAILTQPLMENYGVIPQNFALKYKLNKLGFELVTANHLGNHQLSIRKFLNW